MSLAAVPVYLWARTLVSRRSALAAAVLTLATPGARLLRPGDDGGAVLSAAGRSSLGGRSRDRTADQAQPDAAAGSPSSPSARRGSRRSCSSRRLSRRRCSTPGSPARGDGCRRQLPAAVGLAVLLVGVGDRGDCASGKAALGGYDVVASTSYSVGAAARFVLYHGASLLILCGLFPVAGRGAEARRGAAPGRSTTSGCGPTSRSRRRSRSGSSSRSASSRRATPTGSSSGT